MMDTDLAQALNGGFREGAPAVRLTEMSKGFGRGQVLAISSE